MYLSAEKKQEFFKKYGGDEKNTGSTQAQIAMFTYRITHLTEHLKNNRKDFGTQKSLLDLVGKRRRLLNYYMNKDIVSYRELIKELGIRK